MSSLASQAIYRYKHGESRLRARQVEAYLRAAWISHQLHTERLSPLSGGVSAAFPGRKNRNGRVTCNDTLFAGVTRFFGRPGLHQRGGHHRKGDRLYVPALLVVYALGAMCITWYR